VSCEIRKTPPILKRTELRSNDVNLEYPTEE
jgi:hypothetical protein